MGRPAKPTPHKTCPHCSKPMARRRFKDRLEDLAAFMRRVYCDRRCMALAYVKPVPSHTDTFHWRARRMRGPCCEACGGATMLAAHHIDGNVRNNSPENIQNLCVSCHATHHHRARRAGLTVAGRMASKG